MNPDSRLTDELGGNGKRTRVDRVPPLLSRTQTLCPVAAEAQEQGQRGRYGGGSNY